MLVLAYHSLEDRMVKQRFADWSRTEEPVHLPRGLATAVVATRSPGCSTRRPLAPDCRGGRRATRVPRAHGSARSSGSG